MEKVFSEILSYLLDEAKNQELKENKELLYKAFDHVLDIEGRVAKNKGEISDGSHTFNELYYHRMMLFAVICKTYKDVAWKSWKHDDGSMYPDYFIVGLNTSEGSYTYHYHKDHWDMFDVEELEYAPKYDGHKPEDIGRLMSLIK